MFPFDGTWNWIRLWKGGLLGRATILPPMEDKECPEGNADEANAIVPTEGLAQIGDGKNREDSKRSDFLNGFELGAVELIGADPVRGHLETILEKGYAPTGDDHFPERSIAKFQVAVPGEGHKDVGNGEQDYRAQDGLL
jgi:hypothetical protein